ncbi:MAG: hypothetical protein PHI90_11250 [Clostridia bacterium]|nr:hypothetical protein [Clostridia bacterium]MDD4049362.1 hypothetical protein [Clostridia bacterium]
MREAINGGRKAIEKGSAEVNNELIYYKVMKEISHRDNPEKFEKECENILKKQQENEKTRKPQGNRVNERSNREDTFGTR